MRGGRDLQRLLGRGLVGDLLVEVDDGRSCRRRRWRRSQRRSRRSCSRYGIVMLSGVSVVTLARACDGRRRRRCGPWRRSCRSCRSRDPRWCARLVPSADSAPVTCLPAGLTIVTDGERAVGDRDRDRRRRVDVLPLGRRGGDRRPGAAGAVLEGGAARARRLVSCRDRLTCATGGLPLLVPVPRAPTCTRPSAEQRRRPQRRPRAGRARCRPAASDPPTPYRLVCRLSGRVFAGDGRPTQCPSCDPANPGSGTSRIASH